MAGDTTATVIDIAAAGMPGPMVNGPGDPADWDAINWRARENQVRRLRQRIFKAAQATSNRSAICNGSCCAAEPIRWSAYGR
jgi:hypothetical protein